MRTKTVPITDEVAAVLRRCTFTESTVALPPEQLPRPLYDAVNKVLDAKGGKWNRSKKVHVFPENVDPRTVFADALASGTIVHDKKTRQAFYTPVTIAALVAKRAMIEPKQAVLEPSAGEGALIQAALAASPGLVVAVEIDAAACERLRAEFPAETVRVVEGDFLRFQPATGIGRSPPNALATVDRIVMNPPFTGGQDVEHVRHAFRFLKPNGRLVAIMSGSVQTNTTRAYVEFHDWLKRHTEDRAFEKLEPGAFKESGTNVQAVLFSCRYKPTGGMG